jgi:serpin B
MRRTALSTLAILVAVSSVRCGDDLAGPREITSLPRELTTAEQLLIEADNSFGLKLFREIHAQQDSAKNIFISPLSVAMVLGMLYNGAAGETFDAMQLTLELQGLTLQEVNESYRSLIALLRDLDPSVEFGLGNSLWYDEEEFYVFPEYEEVVREYFDAEVTGMDFSSPGAADSINDWVADQTRGRIDDIVGDRIPGNVLAFLLNAIYFKGLWTIPFNEEYTHLAEFTLQDSTVKQVEMMSHPIDVDLLYGSSGGVWVFELPYGGRAYHMTILLPTRGTSVDSLVQALDSDSWNELVGALAPHETRLDMPKFTLEYELDMEDVVTALGNGLPFWGGDFSRMYESFAGLDAIHHKTFVEVNEEGTEAAAVTQAVFILSGPPAINRPFVVAIRESISGTILFIGVIYDPAPSA